MKGSKINPWLKEMLKIILIFMGSATLAQKDGSTFRQGRSRRRWGHIETSTDHRSTFILLYHVA
jgi:hypothetical protein